MSRSHSISSLLLTILFCAVSFIGKSQTDTLARISEMLTKEDSVQSLHLFRKFTWNIRVRHLNGSVEQHVTKRPDTVLKADDLDTIQLSASFFVDTGLRYRIIPMHYALEGSVLMRINGKQVLATGVFEKEHKRRVLIKDGYADLIFTDSVENLSLTYLPYPRTRLFELGLKLYEKSLADEKRLQERSDDKESAAKGFYYLALSIVFFFLFIFFREKTENLYFACFCFFAALFYLWDFLETEIIY